jgi:hypothetical protein
MHAIKFTQHCSHRCIGTPGFVTVHRYVHPCAENVSFTVKNLSAIAR